MTETVFVDTNVLVYRFDAGKRDKQKQAEAWLTRLWQNRSGRISYQVLREFYVTVTRKLGNQLDMRDARDAVVALFAWQPAMDSDRMLSLAWDVEDRWAISWWDALIVAAALEQSCSILLTEDLQDGQDFDGVRVVDPFTHAPDDVLG
jgi:predicted nucleic acid-binding protein